MGTELSQGFIFRFFPPKAHPQVSSPCPNRSPLRSARGEDLGAQRVAPAPQAIWGPRHRALWLGHLGFGVSFCSMSGMDQRGKEKPQSWHSGGVVGGAGAVSLPKGPSKRLGHRWGTESGLQTDGKLKKKKKKLEMQIAPSLKLPEAGCLHPIPCPTTGAARREIR